MAMNETCRKVTQVRFSALAAQGSLDSRSAPARSGIQRSRHTVLYLGRGLSQRRAL